MKKEVDQYILECWPSDIIIGPISEEKAVVVSKTLGFAIWKLKKEIRGLAQELKREFIKALKREKK